MSGHLFITSCSFHLFNKTDFEQYLSKQKCSPRGHILKFLTLASKPTSPRKCPVLGSKTALRKRKIAYENFTSTSISSLVTFFEIFFFSFFFFFRPLAKLCPCSLAVASSIPVFGLKMVCPGKVGPWLWTFFSTWPWPRALCPRLHLCL